MRSYKNIFVIALLVTMAACQPKGVAVTPFTGPVRANDDIASSIKILITAENNLETQKVITPQEGLKVIDGLSALNGANVQFSIDLAAAKLSGDKSALRPSLDALRKAVNDLNTNGVLGIKSEKAKQVFSLTMGAISLSLGILEGFVGN